MSDVILRFEASDLKFEFCGVEGAESSVLAFVAIPDSLNVPISVMTSTKNWGDRIHNFSITAFDVDLGEHVRTDRIQISHLAGQYSSVAGC